MTNPDSLDDLRRRVRRPCSLVGYWENKEFLVENYLTGKRAEIPIPVLDLLNGLNGYQEPADLISRWHFVPEAEALLAELISRDLLLVEGTEKDMNDARVDTKWTWGHNSRFYHYSTNDVPFEGDLEVAGEALRKRAKENPPPSPFLDREGATVQLEKDSSLLCDSLGEVLTKRRTCRDFASSPLSKSMFSAVLQWTWGKTHTVTNPDFGKHLLKTSPSGGARHPIEVYPLVLNVEDIEPGIFHYNVRDHSLTQLRAGSFEDLAVEACSGQEWVKDAAVLFFMTAVLVRSMWKYQHAHAYRVLQMDAGHLGQTFHLVCTALGLGPFTTAATADRILRAELDLDAASEIPVYAAATGYPTAF